MESCRRRGGCAQKPHEEAIQLAVPTHSLLWRRTEAPTAVVGGASASLPPAPALPSVVVPAAVEHARKGAVVGLAHLWREIDLKRLHCRLLPEAAQHLEALLLALQVCVELHHVGVGVVMHWEVRWGVGR